ncbi:unnamed protein product [Cladocopium goreaui]|uniref:Uncharacterized protein n=1 Tax=Cladocopium goreaui TaxID=2562237 RepID=A0A9P1BHD9_9DINO|nr:unnamed protein product [Cladocopium goreaui]
MSESDPALRQRLKDLYHPQKISADCAKYKGVEKLIHVYGSGFPCQPFSSIGRVIDVAASSKFQGQPSLNMITGRAKVVGRVTPESRIEKAELQGWSSEKTMELSVREYGLALGNAWPLPVATRILEELNRAMGWSTR